MGTTIPFLAHHGRTRRRKPTAERTTARGRRAGPTRSTLGAVAMPDAVIRFPPRPATPGSAVHEPCCVDDLEVGAGDLAEIVEVVVVPAVARGAGDVPRRAVV